MKSVRWNADQAVDADQPSMAELLRPDGYIVPVCPAVPFAMSAAGVSTVYRQAVLAAGRAGNNAEHVEDV